jgi:hypothetical protein
MIAITTSNSTRLNPAGQDAPSGRRQEPETTAFMAATIRRKGSRQKDFESSKIIFWLVKNSRADDA